MDTNNNAEYYKEIRMNNKTFYYDIGEKNNIITIRLSIYDSTVSFGFDKKEFNLLLKCFQDYGFGTACVINKLLPYDEDRKPNTYYNKPGRSFENFTKMRKKMIKNIFEKESMNVKRIYNMKENPKKDDDSSTDSNSSF